jgi:hypothetical protein
MKGREHLQWSQWAEHYNSWCGVLSECVCTCKRRELSWDPRQIQNWVRVQFWLVEVRTAWSACNSRQSLKSSQIPLYPQNIECPTNGACWMLPAQDQFQGNCEGKQLPRSWMISSGSNCPVQLEERQLVWTGRIWNGSEAKSYSNGCDYV